MIKTIFRLVVLLLLVVGWGLAGLSLHVIRTPDEIPITLVPKERFGISDTYVDTRQWTLDDVPNHPALVGKLVRTGKADVLRHVVKDGSDVSNELGQALQRAGDRREQEKTTQPTTTAGKTIGQLLGKLF